MTDIDIISVSGKPKYIATCVCFCGKKFRACVYSIKNGTTKSCGCYRKQVTKDTGLRNRTHGHYIGNRESPTLTSWRRMLYRCRDKANKYYGGRGVTVCKEWQESFPRFLSDMGKRPVGKTIDRINTNGNYEPSNCRWSSLTEQAANKRKNKNVI